MGPFVATLLYFVVAALCVLIGAFIFTLITKYNDMDEIKKGNIAAAMALCGKVFGIANVLRFSIVSNDSILMAFVWAGVGFVLLLVGYFLFELVTTKFRVDEEIAADNRAVGLLSMVISIGLSFVVGASLT